MNTINKNIYILAILLFFTVQFSFATIYQTVKNGNFNTPDTWTPSIPIMHDGFYDTIYINHKVNIHSRTSIYGTLEVKSSGEINGNAGFLFINENSTLINNGIINTKKLFCDWSHNNIVNNGALTIKEDLINLEGYFENNGTITVKGKLINSTAGVFENNGALNVTKKPN